MALLTSVGSKPCVLAFSDDGEYLAAGATSLYSSTDPALRLLRTCDATPTHAWLGLELSYRCPAGFARVAWSKPCQGSSGGGLIAGGLKNGTVAVWDPVNLPILLEEDRITGLQEGICSDQLENCQTQVRSSILLDKTSGNLTKDCDDKCDVQNLQMTTLKKREIRSDPFRSDALAKFNMIPDYIDLYPVQVRSISMSAGTKKLEEIDEKNGRDTMVAMFSNHAGPVSGLCFSPHAPNYLASGGDKGRMRVWDLQKPYMDVIPTTDHVISNGDISFLAWSPCKRNILAASSYVGETMVMDLGAKSPIIGNCQTNSRISTVQWVPNNLNQILTADQNFSTSVFKVWDMRKMASPVVQFGKDIGTGVNSLSFCPIDGDKFLVSTSEDIYTCSIGCEEISGQLLCGTNCLDVHYKGKSEEVFGASTEDSIRMYKWEVIDNTDSSDLIC